MSFRFKQFFIEDSKCAMKVGTDGVLLGCWKNPSHPPLKGGERMRILDVGTGSGLIARMLMQRFPEAEVEGIDIDEAAVEQARENGVKAFHSSLQEWKNDLLVQKDQKQSPKIPKREIVHELTNLNEFSTAYDLIVSNPPYFRNSLKNPDKGRQTARHTDTLSYEELVKHSARLLTMHGQLAIILPAEAEEEIRRIAEDYSLYCTHVTRVYSKETKPARRVLLAFQNLSPTLPSREGEKIPIEDTLVLEDEKGGRSEAYRELAKDFYL